MTSGVITKADPDSPFWTAAREASERVEQWPAWKRGVLERPAPVKTTITVPVTWAARVAITCDDFEKLVFSYGLNGTYSKEQSAFTQGQVNTVLEVCEPDELERDLITRDHARWAAQARKQRGLGS